MGVELSGAVELDGWARPSPSRTVRAVMATSKPRRAERHRPCSAYAAAGAGDQRNPTIRLFTVGHDRAPLRISMVPEH